MAKICKKFFALLISAALCLSLVPGVFAAESEDNKCGDNAYWSIDENGVLTVSGTGTVEMGDWDYDSFTSVVIEEGITGIGSMCFWECDITSLSLPSTLTEIGSAAFMGCPLVEVVIPEGVTKLNGAFRLCEELTSITLPSTLTTLGEYEFDTCASLRSITISASVTFMDCEVFSGCSRLSKITFLGDAPQLGEYGGPFGGQSFLRIYYPEGNPTWTEEYKAELVSSGIGSYAWGDEDFAPIQCGDNAYWTLDENGVLTVSGTGEIYYRGSEIPSGRLWNSRNVTSAIIEEGITGISSDAFKNGSLTSVSLPSTLEYIGSYAFFGCPLEELELPEGLLRLGELAFAECKNLTSVTIPASVTKIEMSVFNSCTNLKEITFLGDAPTLVDGMPPFSGWEKTVYYPADNPTWDNRTKADYAEWTENCYWIPFGPNIPVSIEYIPETLTVTEGDCIEAVDFEGNVFPYYLWQNGLMLRLTFPDGSQCDVSAEDFLFEHNGKQYLLATADDQTYNNVWTVGEHYVEAGIYSAETFEYYISLMNTVTVVHDFADATCTAPKTCKVCGEIEGEALGHDFAEATCAAPKTCKLCGVTEGAAGTHADGNEDGKCDTCGRSTITVTKVEFTPASITITEGTNGEIKTHFAFGEYFWYNWKSLTTAVLTFSDGNTMEMDLSAREIVYKDGEYSWDVGDFQSVSNWKAGNTYELELNVYNDDMGPDVSARLRVSIVHDFADCTCTEPRTCKVCGYTEGEAPGHTFTDATCTAPKTCTVCGETEGEALGHDFTDATCSAPKTCKVCGETEGEALEHPDADYDNLCDVCGVVIKTVDIDTDGDGKADINLDTDGDGEADVNLDRDGDKLPDLNVDTDGDGKADENVDTDGDGLPNYAVVEGANGKHYKDQPADLTFRINGLFAGFQGLEVNGEPVPAEYYEVCEGSTVITLKAAYLTSLDAGSYTVTAVYTDGTVDYSFAVADEKPLPPATPETGDATAILPLFLLLILSVTGLAACVILRKKRAH